MNVIYTGQGSLRFHSAPSRFDYVFFSGVPLEIKLEDEEFFKHAASRPSNPWRIEGVVEVAAKTAADVMVDAVDAVAGKIVGKGKKKGAYRGDE